MMTCCRADNVFMGRSYWFECAKCGYRAKVSGHGDRGLPVFVQTISCRDCKELYDAVVRARIAKALGGDGANSVRSHPGLLTSASRSQVPSFQSASTRLT